MSKPALVRAAACALIVAGLAASSASASVTVIKVNPTKPIVDDSITVTFTADRTLKPGYKWTVGIIATDCYDGLASNFKTSTKTVKKGKSLSLRFRPTDPDVLGNANSTWCQGKATARVQISHVAGDDSDKIVGRKSFRFFGQP